MSLFVTSKPHTTDELLAINNHAYEGQDYHYVPGQTITYSFLTTGYNDIFDSYESYYDDPSAPFDISLDGDVWSSNPNWADEAHEVTAAASEIIDIDFQYTASVTNSDLRWVATHDELNTSITGYSYLTPSFDMDGQNDGNDAGILIYNKPPYLSGDLAEAELGGGNERKTTMLHELGHFLGLSHPHTGDDPYNVEFAQLNDGKYDIMSYLYGDADRKTITTSNGSGSVTETAFSYGTFVNFTPLNIAALQDLYGANTSTHTGDNVYTLTDAKTEALDVDGSDGTISVGRAYYSIWDNGGIDEIVYNGDNRVLINLNAATLELDEADNDAGLVEMLDRVADSEYFAELYPEFSQQITESDYYAAGFFSQILTDDDNHGFNVDFNGKFSNTLGGYAIANSVEIENASGGSSDDLLIGNALDNTLNGNGGDDSIFDGAGNDTVNGGSGQDVFYVGTGDDEFDGGSDVDNADFTTSFINYNITIEQDVVTVEDIFDNKYGENTFSDVESFTFAGSTFSLTDLPLGNQYEREFADLVSNDLITEIANVNSDANSTNDTYWGNDNNNNFYADLLNDRYEGKAGTDNIIFSGDKADYSFSVGSGSDLVVTLNADSTKFDVLHSVETLEFDDGTVGMTAQDLGLSNADFLQWQTDYELA